MELEKFKLGGTYFKQSDLKEGKVLSLQTKPDLRYAWDDGVAIGRYLAGLKAGKIMARRCNKCDRVMIPPRMYCELCWRPTDEWVYVEDTGTVNTFCISHVDWKAGRLDIKGGTRPFTPAVIEIDGASKGMGILHHINKVDPKKIIYYKLLEMVKSTIIGLAGAYDIAKGGSDLRLLSVATIALSGQAIFGILEAQLESYLEA